MTKYIASLLLGALVLGVAAAPASAAWWGNGGYATDYRWNNWNDRYYNGYYYRSPPVVYATPYNYGYVPPPVVYGGPGATFGGPGFSLTIRP